MRTRILAAIVPVGVLLFGSGAHALVPVEDIPVETNTTNIPTDDASIVKNTTAIAKSASQQYDVLTAPQSSVSGMFADQDDAAIQNPMPKSENVMTELETKAPPTLTDAGQKIYGQDNSGTTGSDPVLIAQDTTMKVSSNIQGMAVDNLNGLQQRLQKLDDMNQQLAKATSITEINAINGRIAVESIAVQAQQAQAANLVALATAQAEINRESEAQAMRQEHTQTAGLFASASLQ